MGRLTRWLARRGAVGGTARWAVRSYIYNRDRYSRHDSTEEPAIYRLMIWDRYQTLPDQAKMEYLGEKAYEVAGLMGLVVEILKVEASLAENEPWAIRELLEVISDELEKSGLSQDEIYGVFGTWTQYMEVAQIPPRLDATSAGS